MRAHGFSLWLVPEGEVRARLCALIEALAGALGSPAFAPHVTLLGGAERPELDMRAACATLSRTLHPLTIRLLPVDAHDEYFRCVIAPVAETRALRRARAKARRALGAGAVFMPHLSLAYGRLPASKRAAVLREAAPASGERFVARRLELVQTDGEVGEWRVVEAWLLGGRGSPPIRSSRRTRGAGAAARSRPSPPGPRTRGSRPKRRRRSSRR